MADVIIIGAGAAGLMAARELSDQQIDIIVLEARERFGGRIHTYHKNFSMPVEAGAEFIHGDFSLTNVLLKEAGIRALPLTGRSYTIENDEIKKGDTVTEDWNELMDQLKKLKKDVTMATFLQQHFADKKYASLIAAVRNFVQGYDAADVNKISACAIRDEWIQEEGFKQYRVEGGYGKLINFLKEQCDPERVKFFLSHPVKTIEWNEGSVKIKTDKAKELEASKVIITVPLGVLYSNTIAFHPSISDHLQAAKGFGFGGVIKFVVEFKESFWEKRSTSFRHLPSLNFLFSDASVPTWWSSLPHANPILTGWLAGPAAMQLQKNEDELLSMAIQSLTYLTRSTREDLVNQITKSKVFNWISEPFSRGAYAYTTLDTATSRKTLNTPVANTLFFAGEALYEGPEMGTVEAALRSGKDVAQRLIENSKIYPKVR